MSSILGNFRIGEDVIIALDAVTGDISSVTAVTAAMRKVRFSGTSLIIEPGDPIPVSVTTRADGWTLTVSAAVTETLPDGLYGIDARLLVAGGVEITDQTAVISLTQAAVP